MAHQCSGHNLVYNIMYDCCYWLRYTLLAWGITKKQVLYLIILESTHFWVTVSVSPVPSGTSLAAKPAIVHVALQEPKNYKCWLCKSQNHWLDQCRKFASMNQEDRLKAVKENHACFSCLKRAGRDHQASNWSRRRQCTEMYKDSQCKFYHHPLLHPTH